jgi:HAD superfamily, subfamily IIIB (Acid phosphatase)
MQLSVPPVRGSGAAYGDPLHDSLSLLHADARPSTVRRNGALRLAVELLLACALLASVCTAAALSARLRAVHVTADERVSAECMHALGGGTVAPGGSMHPPVPSYCADQLHAYASNGAYWREVQLAADNALAVFGFLHSSSSSSSNGGGMEDSGRTSIRHLPVRSMRTIISSSSSSSGSKPPQGLVKRGPSSTPMRQLVVFDIDETLLSNLEQIVGNIDWEHWVAAARAPPLRPVQQLYRRLCEAGYALALVTGRGERARASTLHNLEAAGYGTPCTSAAARDAGSCCFEALLMRPHNDTRLASVYKPWARRELLQQGSYNLSALVGDQFSDLNGEDSAPLAFKLPNPFYYIL